MHSFHQKLLLQGKEKFITRTADYVADCLYYSLDYYQKAQCDRRSRNSSKVLFLGNLWGSIHLI